MFPSRVNTVRLKKPRQSKKLAPGLSREPFGNALLRIGAGFRIGAEMAAFRCCGVQGSRQRTKWEIRAIEIVISAWVDHDMHQRAAPTRAVDHLPAGGRRTDIVLGANQDQRRHAGAPAKTG